MSIKHRNQRPQHPKRSAAARPVGVGDHADIRQGERTIMPIDTDLEETDMEQEAPESMDDLQRARADALRIAEEALQAASDLDAAILARAQGADDEDEDASDEDESDDDEEDEDKEDEEDEEKSPPPPQKKAKRAEEPALTRGVSVKAFTTPNLAELAYIPITRRDDEKREIEGVLSDEQVDTFGTIFDYDSMKRAVNERWHGNVREQHDPKKAVGRGVHVFCDDDTKTVLVRARISKGAEDTWQKIQDGTLSGFSIGASNANTVTRMIGDKPVKCYTDFALAEVSVVDAPSNPGAARSGLTIYRSAAAVQGEADVYADVLQGDEPQATPVSAEAATTPVETRTQMADATPAPALAETVVQPDAILTRAELGDTMSGQPDLSSAPPIDHAGIEAAMNGETGHAHKPHTHPYTDGLVHDNDHAHAHTDGTPSHPHRHTHAHLGDGDGSKPHVHLHEHGHQYRMAASDLERTQGGDYLVRHEAFIGQDDPRMQTYQPIQERTAVPAALPAQAAETHGIAVEEVVARVQATEAQVVQVRNQAERLKALNEGRTQTPDLTRVGARISGDTRTGMHEAALSILRTCDCPVCQSAIQCFDPDMDGDDDADESGDTDGDMAAVGRAQRAILTRRIATTVQSEVQRALSPITTQLRAIGARLTGVQAQQAPDLTRMQTQLDALQAAVPEMLDLVRKIAETEQPGGPILRGTMLAAEKRLATGNPPTDAWTTQDIATLNKAARLGITSAQDQVQTAAAIIAQTAGIR